MPSGSACLKSCVPIRRNTATAMFPNENSKSLGRGFSGRDYNAKDMEPFLRNALSVWIKLVSSGTSMKKNGTRRTRNCANSKNSMDTAMSMKINLKSWACG